MFPGDVVVGDADGVIIVPAEIADAIADEAVEMTAYEDFVMERVRAGARTIGLYPPTDETNLAAFASWRAAHDAEVATPLCCPPDLAGAPGPAIRRPAA